MKKYKLFPLLILLSLSSCNSNNEDSSQADNYYIGNITYSFNNGKAVINYKSENLDSFNIYEKSVATGSYRLYSTTNDNYFETPNLKTNYKIVGIKNNKEINEAFIEVKSYYEGVFDSQNVKLYFPTDNQTKLNNSINLNYQTYRGEEWTDVRTEYLFMPGDYSNVTISLPYYTSVRGLGYSPDDVVFKKLLVQDHPASNNALINFWRSLENASFNEESRCGVSQATSIRRAHFKNNLILCDIGASSGGFIANTKIDGVVNPGSQQQFLMRNDVFSSWTHSNFNMVFEGCIGTTPIVEPDTTKTTIINESYDVYEKPYLVFDENQGFGVVISLDKSTKGYNWNERHKFIPLSDFYIFHPNDNSDKINEILKTYKYTLFTPGIYNIDKPIEVNLDDSIIFGLGYATLSSTVDMDKMMIVNSSNNIICSLLFQNEAHINNYLTIEKTLNEGITLLSDLFFRVGGQSEKDTSVDCSLIINQDNVIGDNFWIWTADHGKHVGYTANYARNGAIINGNNVICHGLMVEHFYEYQTIWNGENGKVILYQSETPYTPPSQKEWQKDDPELPEIETLGYASYKINDDINNHLALGIGIYYVNFATSEEYCYSALEAPYNENIDIRNVSALYFVGKGNFIHCINNIDGNKIYVKDKYDELTDHYNMYIVKFDNNLS